MWCMWLRQPVGLPLLRGRNLTSSWREVRPEIWAAVSSSAASSVPPSVLRGSPKVERVADAEQIHLSINLVKDALKAPEHPPSIDMSRFSSLSFTLFSSSMGGRLGKPSAGQVAWFNAKHAVRKSGLNSKPNKNPVGTKYFRMNRVKKSLA